MNTTTLTAQCQQFELTSAQGDSFLISVYLPANYTPASEERYQVMIAPDGEIVGSIINGAIRFGSLAAPSYRNLMLVTIGYGLDLYNDTQELMRLRTNDLTHAADEGLSQFFEMAVTGEATPTGGANEFLTFIEDVLLPHIESAYRGDENGRILIGGSMGGEFATYTLVTRPELFDNYIILSPMLGTAQRNLFDLEAAYAEEHDDLKANVYLSMGSEEEQAPWSPMGPMGEALRASLFFEFWARLSQRGYDNLHITKRIFAGATHISAILQGMAEGMDKLIAGDAGH